MAFIDQEIIVDNVSCPFISGSPADARFSYDDRIDDRPNQVGGKQLVLDPDCHEDITKRISPLRASYDSTNEVFLRHSDGQVYFCSPLVRV